MTTTTTITLILLTALLMSHASAQKHKVAPKRHVHKDFQTFEPTVSDMPKEVFFDGERVLNSVTPMSSQKSSSTSSSTASPIRIAVDYTYWTETVFAPYFKGQLVPAIVSYLQAAIKVKYPLTSNLVTSASTLCGYNTPSILTRGGVAADLFVIFNSASDYADSWMGATTVCQVSSGVQRPIIINIGINVPYFSVPNLNTDPLDHDININVITHEFIHGLGFNGGFYSAFIDSYGNPLVNPVKTVMLSGISRTVLDLPPLTARLRQYYGCSTIPGLFLENDGTAHPENRFFQWDIMASGDVMGSRITQFNLAFLEGTGWYAPNYSYAEPYFFGMNEGCGFYADGLAAASDTTEYCSGTGMGCTETGESGGYCVTTSALENYRVITSQPLLNCENPVGVYYTPFAWAQVYGRGLGSKCFTGNLTTYSSAPQTSYCLSYTCTGSGSYATLQVLWGQTAINCAQAGPVSINGYLGSFNCPDPVKYCSTIGVPTCRRNCSGRGTCVAGKCICNAGFLGNDCGFAANPLY